jgi:hypothetical protein
LRSSQATPGAKLHNYSHYNTSKPKFEDSLPEGKLTWARANKIYEKKIKINVFLT